MTTKASALPAWLLPIAFLMSLLAAACTPSIPRNLSAAAIILLIASTVKSLAV